MMLSATDEKEASITINIRLLKVVDRMQRQTIKVMQNKILDVFWTDKVTNEKARAEPENKA